MTPPVLESARPRAQHWVRYLVAGLLLGALAVVGCGGRKAPVVVIGLDGAEFDLLVPWMEQGELPNLKSLMDRSAIGKLRSVYPVLSPVAWTSAVTGCNPGKHGIFDFQKQTEDGTLIIETATHRRALPIWLLLSEAGKRVAVMNVPMSYPPDPVRGEMISGFPFPKGDVNITYPPELQAKLGDYPLDYLGLNLFNRTPRQMLNDFLAGQAARRRVALDWLHRGDFDFYWLVFTDPDKVQHFFWKYMDPKHPLYKAEEAAEFGNAILDVWHHSDQILGEMLALIPKDATIVVLSDHGFDAIYHQINMATWLARTDLQGWLKDHAIPPMSITNGVLHYMVEGTVTGASDREAFLDKFVDLGHQLKDPRTGQCPLENVFRREEIYAGRMVEKAPDVVIQEADKYYLTRGSAKADDPDVVEDAWSTSFSAFHRPDGILLYCGPQTVIRTHGSVRERLAQGGDFDRAHILDVTPTLLALMDQIIPAAMDGRVLKEAIDPKFLAQSPPRVEEVEGFLLDREIPTRLTDEEKERLKALPYIQ